jgi:hypothetical protein
MTNLLVRCPQCPDLVQGTSVPRERLQQMLESGEEITTIGSICGHVFPLSAEQIESIRKAMAAGTL